MKYLFSVIFVYICFVQNSFASEITETDVRVFFDSYVNAANSYDDNYFTYYSDNPTIIRVVEKPDGNEVSVKVPFSRYKSETKKSSFLAKLRQYKNSYSNIKIFKLGKDYKVVAMRMPSTSDYKLPSHFIIGEDSNGNLKIKEESMNTRVQRFLKGA